MRQFGLIGYPLSHSFSKGFFANKFAEQHINGVSYENYPLESIAQFDVLWETQKQLEGINITIPYKKMVIPFLQHASSVVQKIQACNCIRKYNNELYGYNTDVIGFEKSLQPYLKPQHQKALILGTGGAAAAVEWVLQKLNINYLLVTRIIPNTIKDEDNNYENAKSNKVSFNKDHYITYENLTNDIVATHTLIINTSPVGMYPNVTEFPMLPYDAISAAHHLYDLIYNPTETIFLQKGKAKGATIQNGLEMLHLQAEASWEIWNATTPLVQ